MKICQDKPAARRLALACLTAWSGTGRPVQGFLDSIIHAANLSSEDRQLAVMLVMGAVRRQGVLDQIISRFSKTALAKMKPLTLAALRIGIFQLCFLERVPATAAVNETVAALKKMRQPAWLLGFVNGLLRNIARHKEELPRPEDFGPEINHPAWLIARWQRQFGVKKTQTICQINDMEPQLCLRSSGVKKEELVQRLTEQGISTVPGRYAPDSLLVPDWRGPVTALPGFAQGLFQVQDQAAQLACLLLGPFQEQGRYLDACAGLGGKTCALAALLPAGASLTAVEPDARRISLLHENLARQQLQDRVSIFHGRLEEFAATAPPPFDGILLDAPCSGTGVIRRQPDIRWNRQPDDFAKHQAVQLGLLQTAAKLLATNGVLVYATCSLEPEENQQLIAQFLSAQNDCNLSDCHDLLPPVAAELLDGQGCFAPLPSQEMDGFFAARLN
ncbi:16S rRNA (cytosine(967)-C(5))-methyltransferase [Candidatus Electronema halotolerans]